MLDIRFSTLLDMNNIMNFIDNHWKKNHILSKDKNLFLYEYQDENIINFVIAIDDKNNIYGILGFIKSSNINSDIWLAMWKAVRHDNHPMLGVELLEYLRSSNKYNRLTCPGINIKVIPIYNYLGFYTDYLHQYVMINTNLKNFNILKIKDTKCPIKLDFIKNKKYSFKKIEINIFYLILSLLICLVVPKLFSYPPDNVNFIFFDYWGDERENFVEYLFLYFIRILFTNLFIYLIISYTHFFSFFKKKLQVSPKNNSNSD